MGGVGEQRNPLTRKLSIQGIENGGLKMPDIFVPIKTVKLMWIEEMLKKTNKYSLIAMQNSKIIVSKHCFSHNMSTNTW